MEQWVGDIHITVKTKEGPVDVPCTMRLTQTKSTIELFIDTHKDAPKEVFLSCLLVTAIRYANENGMDPERAMKDLIEYTKQDHKMEVN